MPKTCLHRWVYGEVEDSGTHRVCHHTCEVCGKDESSKPDGSWPTT